MTTPLDHGAAAPLISLIGYRGTGKSTVARSLAARLGWPWIDADAELERRAGCTIREIFARQGEGAFRDLEAAIVQDLTQTDRQIVAWGGGVVLREANRQALRRSCVVWLQADPQTIWERTSHDPTTAERRPQLTVGGLAEIEQLLEVRRPLYAAVADWQIDSAHASPDQIAEQVVCWLAERYPAMRVAT